MKFTKQTNNNKKKENMSWHEPKKMRENGGKNESETP